MDPWFSWTPDSHRPLILMDPWFSWTPDSHGPLILMDPWFSWTPDSHGPLILMDPWFSWISDPSSILRSSWITNTNKKNIKKQKIFFIFFFVFIFLFVFVIQELLRMLEGSGGHENQGLWHVRYLNDPWITNTVIGPKGRDVALRQSSAVGGRCEAPPVTNHVASQRGS
jgi:hypothetical protein